MTEKFMRYCEEGQGALAGKARLLKEKFSPEEVNTFTRVLGALLDSLG